MLLTLLQIQTPTPTPDCGRANDGRLITRRDVRAGVSLSRHSSSCVCTPLVVTPHRPAWHTHGCMCASRSQHGGMRSSSSSSSCFILLQRARCRPQPPGCTQGTPARPSSGTPAETVSRSQVQAQHTVHRRAACGSRAIARQLSVTAQNLSSTLAQAIARRRSALAFACHAGMPFPATAAGALSHLVVLQPLRDARSVVHMCAGQARHLLAALVLALAHAAPAVSAARPAI